MWWYTYVHYYIYIIHVFVCYFVILHTTESHNQLKRWDELDLRMYLWMILDWKSHIKISIPHELNPFNCALVQFIRMQERNMQMKWTWNWKTWALLLCKVEEIAEVCTPSFTTVCEPISVPVKNIVDKEQCYRYVALQ